MAVRVVGAAPAFSAILFTLLLQENPVAGSLARTLSRISRANGALSLFRGKSGRFVHNPRARNDCETFSPPRVHLSAWLRNPHRNALLRPYDGKCATAV